MAYTNSHSTGVRERFKQSTTLLQVAVLVLASLIPLLATLPVSAAQMTSRSATINKSTIHNGTTFINNDVEFVFGYTNIDTASAKQGIKYDFCTTPLGPCTLPTGMAVQAATHDAQSGWPANATPFVAQAVVNEGACAMATNSYTMCFDRIAVTAGGGAVTHTISGITAPSAIQTVYIRITTYSDAAFATPLDAGTVAVAFVDQLTVNGRVQERLQFCVAAIDDADPLPANVATCSALTDSNVDLGIIDETAVARSPVTADAVNGADDDYGILMLNTNATGGAVVAYYPEADAGATNETRAFRVDNATCTNAGGVFASSSLTDQCFASTENSGTGTDLTTAGTEGFGVHIPCIDTTLGTTTALGSVPAWYDADGTTTSSANCEDTDTSVIFGWNESGTADTLASSTSVVDDEVIKLRFGAQAAPTTPSGEYTVTTTYIATATF